MILFFAGQVGSAEYLAPLLDKWDQEDGPYTLLATPEAAAVLRRAGVPHQSRMVWTRAELEAVIEHVSPRMALISASGTPVEHIAVLAAREVGATTAQYVDYWGNYRRRFAKGDNVWPHAVLAPDAESVAEMLAEGVPSAPIRVVGQPYMESRLAYYAATAPPSARPVALALTQPVARFYGRTLGYDEVDFMDLLLETWINCGGQGLGLEVLVHPAEDAALYRRFQRPGLDLSVRQGDLGDIRAYRVVLGMFSSLLVHGVMAGIPTISVQPGDGVQDICVLSRRGYIPRTTTVSGLAHELMRCASNAPGFSTPGESGLTHSLQGSLDRLQTFIRMYTTDGGTQ